MFEFLLSRVTVDTCNHAWHPDKRANRQIGVNRAKIFSSFCILALVAHNRESGRGIAQGWWWLAPVWNEVDSRSYRPSEDQARRRQIK